MLEDIERLRAELPGAREAVADEKSLEAFRVKYLGKNGLLAGLYARLGQADAAERPALGKAINVLKGELERALATARGAVAAGADAARGDGIDPSLPGRQPWRGRRHILAAVLQEIVEIFHGMGFSVAEGPEVELDYFNFQALNFPEDHPSRDLQDTFYVEDDVLLRTHTSPVQIRYMKEHPPPVRIVVPGRVYRNEALDASHAAEFHQVEGLYVDDGVTLGDLTTTLRQFAHEFFGPAAELRFRPHFFPFTEPSAEADMTCFSCKGGGCRICGGTGWIEILGAGMVHPNVFEHAGYDPEAVTGFAFGMGIERMAMLRHGINDLRLFLENDIRFLSQF